MSSRKRILVAVAFDAASMVALRRAVVLAKRLDLEVRALHVIWGPHTVEGPADERDGARAVKAWATSTGVRLALSAIEVRIGSPDVEITRAVHERPPALLVIGGRSADARDAPGRVASFVARNVAVPVLVTAPPHPSRVIVAATDLRDRRYPVLRAADDVALATVSRATAVHNVAADIGSENVLRRAERLGEVTTLLAGFGDALVTRRPNVRSALEEVAASTDADIVAVGRRGGGGELLETLFGTISRSILVVPVAPPAVEA